jgi:hypothetical protein
MTGFRRSSGRVALTVREPSGGGAALDRGIGGQRRRPHPGAPPRLPVPDVPGVVHAEAVSPASGPAREGSNARSRPGEPGGAGAWANARDRSQAGRAHQQPHSFPKRLLGKNFPQTASCGYSHRYSHSPKGDWIRSLMSTVSRGAMVPRCTGKYYSSLLHRAALGAHPHGPWGQLDRGRSRWPPHRSRDAMASSIGEPSTPLRRWAARRWPRWTDQPFVDIRTP